jgi:hypothetical protein
LIAGVPSGAADWPKTPRALAGRLRRAQPFLRVLGIDVIAGEDDLDAPDLCTGPLSLLPPAVDRPEPPRMPGNGHGRNRRRDETPVTLDPDQSAALREKLLTQLDNITSANFAAAWAREALIAKNSLTAADAKLVEDAFEAIGTPIIRSGCSER